MAVHVEVVPLLVVVVPALFVLMRSAQVAVDRSTGLAHRYDVPDYLIGLTVIAVGTSLPELGSHVIASVGILAGRLDYEITSATVLGGNMGSSITQQLLLFGVFLVGYGAYEMTPAFRRTSYVPMVLASAVTLLLALDGRISRLDGLLMVGVYVAYTYYSLTTRERTMNVPETASTNPRRDGAVLAFSILTLLGSAFVALSSIQRLVVALDLTGSLVGVLTLGLASALPELSTVIDCIRRDAPNVAVGTLVGSNIVNPLLGIGLGGLVSTYSVPPGVVLWDLPFKIVVGAGLLAYALTYTDGVLNRREGTFLVVLYFVYVSGRILVFAT